MPSLEVEQRCIYCRLGNYRLLGMDRETGASKGHDLAVHYGLCQFESVRLLCWECDACGNVQLFRPGAVRPPNQSPWK